MDGGPFKSRLVQQRGLVGVEFSMPLDPDVVRTVYHDLAYIRVLQNVLQSGQKGLQQFQAVVALAVVAHILPSAFARQ